MHASYPIRGGAGKCRRALTPVLRAWPSGEVARAGKPRIFTFGFTESESAAIDAALAALRVPAPTRLRPSQGDVRVTDIVERDADGSGSIASDERLVLFANLPGEAVGGLVDYFKTIGVPRPIYATVTETSAAWSLAELLEHLAEEKRFHEVAREDA